MTKPNNINDVPSPTQQDEIIQTKKYIYIIGSGRSGTSWLQTLIGSHDNVATTVELRLFKQYISSWLDSWNSEQKLIDTGTPFGLPAIITRSDFDQIIYTFLNTVYSHVLALNPNATHILDKHPDNSYSIDLIKHFVPNARFIHIIRDGRDVSVSRVKAGKTLGWFPERDYKSAALRWATDVRTARQANNYADSYLEIRYEDLLQNGFEVLHEVFRFCELDVDDKLVNEILNANTFDKMKKENKLADPRYRVQSEHFSRGVAGGWRDDLSIFDRYRIDRVAGDLLIELGYAEHNWWRNSDSTYLFVPTIVHVQDTLLKIVKIMRWLVKASSIRHS